ncbi:MAG: GEVED domain-containing protein, partial [Chitinophagales bacterium]
MNLIDTTFSLRPKYLLAISAALGLMMTISASAQSVTIPSANTNDSSSRLPLGCFYGYERTAALYLNSEIGLSGYVTQVGFYVNELNSPAINTPVVIKMKSTSNTSLSSVTYDAESSGAIVVWSGNITDAMLSVDSWITFNVITPFNVGSSNLEVIVETNFGSFGGENWNAKQFRQSDANANLCEYWQEDDTLPTEFGELTTMRPNIQLTLAPECSGMPVPGNTMSDVNPVCTGAPFTLSLQNIVAEPGLTYQWQSSPDGSTWTNISGATNATYSTTETATTYYQSIVTCTNGGLTATSSSLQVALEAFYHCYCASNAVTSEDTKIDSVNFGDINTGTDPFLCETYTDYTAFSTSLTPGQPNTIHISNGSCTGEAYEAFAAVYIDYNHNAAFTDASELAFTYGPIFTLNGIPDQVFFVPLTALSGTTGMRIVLQESDAVPSSCSTYTRGETEDYLVNIDALSPCSGAPPVDSTLSTLYSVCPYEDFTLSLKTYPDGTGISYAWQQSTDGINFSPVPGIATTPIYVDTGQVIAHYYRCKITCSGGSFSYSISILVTMKPFYECYCPSYATNVQNDTKIDTVKFGTLNTGSAPDHCESYTDYTSIITDLSEGIPTTIHIVNGSCDQQFYEAMVAVYIDYNQDTSYDDPGELVYSYGPTAGLNTIPDGIITVPATATDGLTGMRIIIQEGDTVPGSCGLYLDGETEDYVVNITSGVCIDPPTPGTATATISSICSGALPVTFSVSLTGYSSGSGQTYQWQSSADGVNFTDIPGQTSTNATETINSGGATTYYRVQVHCGYSTLPSAAAVVTVN